MKAAAFSVVLIVMSGITAGQTSGSGSSSAQTSESSNSAKLQTVRGCLSKTGDTYVILGGNPVRQYRVVGGNTEALKHKLGHTVEVTGPVGQKSQVRLRMACTTPARRQALGTTRLQRRA